MGLKDILKIAEERLCELKNKNSRTEKGKKINKDPGTCRTQLEIQNIYNWNSKGQKRKNSIENI